MVICKKCNQTLPYDHLPFTRCSHHTEICQRYTNSCRFVTVHSHMNIDKMAIRDKLKESLKTKLRTPHVRGMDDVLKHIAPYDIGVYEKQRYQYARTYVGHILEDVIQELENEGFDVL